jgi:hypothetical protein
MIIKRSYVYLKKYPRHYLNYLLFGIGFTVFGYYNRDNDNEILRMGIAGSIAQFSTEIVFHPIDVINTNTKADLIGNMNSLNTTVRIYKKDGLFGFWRGASATYYASLMGGIIYFTSYKYLKKMLSSTENQLNTIAYLISSILGEMLFLTFYYPFDLIRTRMQTRRVEFDYKGVLDAFRKITNGSLLNIKHYRNLYVGAGPSFVLNVSNTTIMFTVLETMREILMKKRGFTSVNQLNTLDYFMCSVVAGVVSGAITNILEVITIHKQLKGSNFHLIHFIRTQGIQALTSGIMARISINTAHTVMLFYVVDCVSKIFKVEL